MALGTPKIVVLRALGLGDVLTAVPALRGLARAFPAHRRLLAAPSWLADVVALTDTGFSVVDLDLRGRTGRFPPLPDSCRAADIAVNLHGRGPQSTAALQATEPDRLIAFGVGDSPQWDDHEHEVSRWCRLLRAADIACDPDDLALQPRPRRVGDGRPVMVVHPGAASPARRWPVSRWTEVARYAAGHGFYVVITGDARERAVAREVATTAGLPADAVVAGATSIGELMGVVAGASRLVCGDTGIAHIATAVGTPSVVLFGPTPPSLWGPPAHEPRHQVLWTGKVGDPHADEPDPGLLEIAVDDVITALRRLPLAA